MKEVIDKMMQFGLTNQEATIYIELTKKSEQSGYELSKKLGISRSNVYSSLASLVTKGAIYLCKEESTKYIPVNVEEFCNNYIRNLEKSKKYLLSEIKVEEENTDSYITIKEEKNIKDKIINMLRMAQKRAYIYVKNERIEELREEIQLLLDRGCKVVLITDKNVDFKNAIIYISKIIKDQIRIIVDSVEVITATEINNALYSKNENFVGIIKDMLKYEIKLIELGEDYE